MAAQEPRSVKRILRWCAWAVFALFVVVALFLLSAWIGSSVPRNGDWSQPAKGVDIMIETNGIHTGIVMPVVTPEKDWSTDFPATDIPAADRPYTHISVSWGERKVFLDTPTWADLSPVTAIGAAIGGDGLLHVAHYVRPAPDSDVRVLRISHAQYARLVRSIERQVLPRDRRPPLRGYDVYDVFYDAPGTYHLGNTCNQWTSDTLASAGIRTGLWTPFPGGVMKWVPQPGA
ncbi:TIGR02117 family protein [Qipengyuania soli]|uniref:TIGR02117 family protein n=1 Tax=Qipengyuania soli TaxID=2782568 RepID=UPI001FEBB627|nr:TIGR02117 family protein [Qipengyuania soli]